MVIAHPSAGRGPGYPPTVFGFAALMFGAISTIGLTLFTDQSTINPSEFEGLLGAMLSLTAIGILTILYGVWLRNRSAARRPHETPASYQPKL